MDWSFGKDEVDLMTFNLGSPRYPLRRGSALFPFLVLHHLVLSDLVLHHPALSVLSVAHGMLDVW